MAKQIPVDKVIDALDNYELADVFIVQKKCVQLIAAEEEKAKELIQKANSTIELIRTAGKE